MSFEIKYHADGNYIYTRLAGKITVSILKEYLEALSPILRKHGCTRVLNDSRDVNIQLSALEILHLPELIETKPDIAFCKRAMLIKPGMSGFIMYETLSKTMGHWLKVFHDVDAALQWLLADETK